MKFTNKTFNCILSLIAFSFTANAAFASTGALPPAWYLLPEDETPSLLSTLQAQEMAQAPDETGATIERIFRLNAKALNQLAPPYGLVVAGEGQPNRPKDWTPWHLELFTTDLTLSATGKVGVLTMGGSAAVQAFWRQQGVKPASAVLETASNETPSIEISPETTPAEISKQLEPAVQVVLAEGKVKDEGRLRSELKRIAGQFQQLVQAISADQAGSSYWVSGFRMDLSITASGNVSWGTFGVDTRLRLEWKRAMRATPAQAQRIARTADASASRLQENLKELVHNIALDLEDTALQNPLSADFYASGFRVGLGMSVSGDLGFAKGSGTLVGHINFSRDAKKPVVYPVQPAGHGTYLVIEKATAAQLTQHLAFARSNGITAKTAQDEAVFAIDRAGFRKGLNRAMKIGAFFAKHAANASTESPTWKIFELKVGFDMSLTGGQTLGTNKAQATTEMAFYNQKF